MGGVPEGYVAGAHARVYTVGANVCALVWLGAVRASRCGTPECVPRFRCEGCVLTVLPAMAV